MGGIRQVPQPNFGKGVPPKNEYVQRNKAGNKLGKFLQGPEIVNFRPSKIGVWGALLPRPPWMETHLMRVAVKKRGGGIGEQSQCPNIS